VTETGLNGLIQNSFALQVPKALHPMYMWSGIRDTKRQLQLMFETAGFELGEAEMKPQKRGDAGPWRHSRLVGADQTYVAPLDLPFQRRTDLPPPLSWAEDYPGWRTDDRAEPWEAFAFANSDPEAGSDRNDFLLEANEVDSPGIEVSRLLCQLLAHRRSLLFGLALARSTFNVLLPCATLQGSEGNDWLAQPAVSLFRIYGRRAFRQTFSFSLFLLPCRRAGLRSRGMSAEEIRHSVKTPWPLASAFDEPRKRDKFDVSGPLTGYLREAAGPALLELNAGKTEEAFESTVTLRGFTETTLFVVTALMTRGPGASTGGRTRREIGDRIVASLSASRVSSIVVVDDENQIEADHEQEPSKGGTGARSSSPVLELLAKEITRPARTEPDALRRLRLDRSMFDRSAYATAVLPADRCLLTVGNGCAQHGLRTSALLEASWAAYMAIGAATATGLIRSVFREISLSDRYTPDQIADVEREAMVDLHETYDIEITVEAYRRRYRDLRDQLGIEAEYEALRRKLEALYRETITRTEGRSDQRLRGLTWAIVILSAFILVGTLVLIFKPGG